jgi:hypothetical protein
MQVVRGKKQPPEVSIASGKLRTRETGEEERRAGTKQAVHPIQWQGNRYSFHQLPHPCIPAADPSIHPLQIRALLLPPIVGPVAALSQNRILLSNRSSSFTEHESGSCRNMVRFSGRRSVAAGYRHRSILSQTEHGKQAADEKEREKNRNVRVSEETDCHESLVLILHTNLIICKEG